MWSALYSVLFSTTMGWTTGTATAGKPSTVLSTTTRALPAPSSLTMMGEAVSNAGLVPLRGTLLISSPNEKD